MFQGGALRLLFMAQDLFEGEKVLALDLETTGTSTNNDRIVQYALIGTLADGTAVNVEQIVKPPIRIPLEASNIHGIYNEDVQDKPALSEVAEELAEQDGRTDVDAGQQLEEPEEGRFLSQFEREEEHRVERDPDGHLEEGRK